MGTDGDMGARVLYELAAKLKRAGAADLRKAFLKEMREAAKPLLPAVRSSAAAAFPAKGGLSKHMSRGARYRTVAKTGATTAGVSIRANKTDPRTDSEGRVAHPVPARGGGQIMRGGRRVTVVQRFPRAVGYFRDPIEAGADGVRRDLTVALQRWAEETLRG